MRNVLPPITPGVRTSEFWVAVVAASVPLLNQAFGWRIDPVAMQSIAAIVIGYVLSRGLSKHGKTETVNVATTGDVTTGSGE